MRKLRLCKADPITKDEPVEPLTIVVDMELPEIDCKDNMNNIYKYHDEQAQKFVDAILSVFPQAMIEPIIIKLMQSKISLYRGTMPKTATAEFPIIQEIVKAIGDQIQSDTAVQRVENEFQFLAPDNVEKLSDRVIYPTLPVFDDEEIPLLGKERECSPALRKEINISDEEKEQFWNELTESDND